MSNVSNSLLQINSIEDLTRKDTVIHRLEPFVKLVITIIYLIVIISVRPNQLSLLTPYIFYPILVMALGEIPFRPLLKYLLIALPFTLFAGISNLIFQKEIAFYIWNLGISEGMISFSSLLLKSFLTVMAVLILISTTSMDDLLYTMIECKVPSIIVVQIMMTYRFIGVLLEEVSNMYHAYILRAPKEKGIKMKDMGPFLGQLIIRSFDRAERIYEAMKCRGFNGFISFLKRKSISKKSWIYITFIGGLLIIMRIVNVSLVIGKLLT